MQNDQLEQKTLKESQEGSKNEGISQLLIDFGPLAAFFITYKTVDIMAATAALVIATIISLAYTYAKTKRVAPMPLMTGILVTVFGGLTIWLNDEQFIKIKPTIVNLLFAAILLGGLLFKKPLLKYALGSAIELEDIAWKKLSFRWGIFFIFLAILNECIWRNFSTEFWVNFKVFGMLVITLMFMVSQIPLMTRYQVEKQEE